MPLCIIAAEVLTVFIDVATKIKNIQRGDHEIKIVNFTDDTTIFLRNFSYLVKIELILKLCEKTSSLEINFSKSHGLRHTKIELTNQDKWPGQNSPSK